MTSTYEYPWISNVKSILDNLCMSYILTSENPQNSDWLANTILHKSQDQNIQSWSASVNESSKCINYRIFKSKQNLKKKNLITLPTKLRNTFINYRLCNNRLPIETCRWVISSTIFSNAPLLILKGI